MSQQGIVQNENKGVKEKGTKGVRNKGKDKEKKSSPFLQRDHDSTSKSQNHPTTSAFFFIKKKDGKLRPIQDY